MKVTEVTNTREHDITLHAQGKDPVTIPGGRKGETGEALVPGVAQVPTDLIVAASGQADAVKHYFNEGWLVMGDESDTAEPAAPAKAAKGKK